MSDVTIIKDDDPVQVQAWGGQGSVGPVGPPGPDGSGWYRPEDFGTTGAAVDSSIAIEAALAVGNVWLEPGKVYGLTRTVAMPGNRTIRLNGAELRILTGHTTRTIAGATANAAIGAYGVNNVAIIGPGVVNGNKIGLGGGAGDRRNGIHFWNCRNFLVEQIIARNCTGYIYVPAAGGANYSSGTIRNCRAENGQYHYEFMQCEDIALENCTSGDGDGDIECGGWVHPVFNTLGCRRIRVSNFYGRGGASGGIYSLANNGTAAIDDLSIEDSHFEVTNAGNACLLGGTAGHRRFYAKNCNFISAEGFGIDASSHVVDSVADGCHIRGKSVAARIGPNSNFDIINSKRIVARPAAGAAAFGIGTNADPADTTIRVRSLNNVFDLESTTEEVPLAGPGIMADRESQYYYALKADELNGQVFVGTGFSAYWFAMQDQFRTIFSTWDSNFQTFVVRANASTPFSIGTVIEVVNATPNSGGRTLTIAGDAGVTLNAVGGVFTVKAWGRARLEKTGANTWILSGDLG